MKLFWSEPRSCRCSCCSRCRCCSWCCWCRWRRRRRRSTSCWCWRPWTCSTLFLLVAFVTNDPSWLAFGLKTSPMIDNHWRVGFRGSNNVSIFCTFINFKHGWINSIFFVFFSFNGTCDKTTGGFSPRPVFDLERVDTLVAFEVRIYPFHCDMPQSSTTWKHSINIMTVRP